MAFDVKHGAKFAARDHIAQRAHRGPEAAIVPDGKCDTRFSAGFEHTSSIGLVQRKRLFTEHVLSRGCAGHHLRRMQRMWCRQQHGIDIRIREHGVKVVE